MSKRIAHITPVYPPYAGGIGVVARAMAEGLAGRGWDVAIITPQSDRGSGETYNHNVRTLNPWLRIGNAAMVPQLARLRNYDLIHLHLPFFGGAEFIILNKCIKRKETKLVVQYHHDADARGARGAIFNFYDRVILPRVISRADKIVVSSLDYARNSRMAKFIDEKLIEIPLGIDSNRFSPNSSGFRLKASGLRLPASSFSILFVGSLDRAHWFKGLEVLLKAIGIIVSHQSIPIRCMIMGEGDLKGSYEKIAQELGIQDHVQFLGNVPHAQLPNYYRNADLFVFPSVSRAEAFGLVVLEAMASGLPVIVSDLPGVRTLVEEGIHGFKVPVNKPQALARRIQDLFEDKSLRDRMGQKSREKVLEGYTWDKIINKIEKIYTDLVNK